MHKINNKMANTCPALSCQSACVCVLKSFTPNILNGRVECNEASSASEAKPITKFVIAFIHRVLCTSASEEVFGAVLCAFACLSVYLCIYLLQCKHQSIYQITIYSATTKSRAMASRECQSEKE